MQYQEKLLYRDQKHGTYTRRLMCRQKGAVLKREELLQIAKPILFNTEMVRAILEDRKTVTRRVVKIPSYVKRQEDGLYTLFTEGTCYENQTLEDILYYLKQPYKVGDVLYVRETWKCWRAHRYEANADIMFKAGGAGVRLEFANGNTDSINRDDYDTFVHKWYDHDKWKPSIHMPKEAARIFLKVKSVRVERLQDMNGADVLKEGVDNGKSNPSMGIRWDNMQKMAFKYLWNSTIKPAELDTYSWDANPYVWVIEFERIQPDKEV